MYRLLDEVKVLRDPIHGYVHIELEVVWNCINAKEFQRLRRIKQLGGAFQVYHTAEHSRFGHSLGVYEIIRRMISEVDDLSSSLSEYEKITCMLAGLLHDIGHGPYSHAFESVTNKNHEQFTIEIITGDSEINRCLKEVDSNLPNDVASIINHTHPNNLLSQLISSQLDADRMDYLLRDAYFTGTKYGEFDLERLLRTIRVKDSMLVIKESGIHSVEDYIMARYHMYWQVYYHPTARSFEVMLNSIFKRLAYLYHNEPEVLKDIKVFDAFLSGEDVSIKDHFILDENACTYGFSLLCFCEDKIVSDLAKRLLNRNLFGYLNINTKSDINKMEEEVIDAGFDPTYYLRVDEASQRPYDPYKLNKESGIWILMNNGKVQELSDASVIVSSLIHGEVKEDPKMYFPKEIIR